MPSAAATSSSSSSTAASRIPRPLQFPLLVALSFASSSLLHSLFSAYTGPGLAAVSRNLTLGWHIGVMVAWKLAELSAAWYACYDYLDLACLTLLNQVPYYFLLNTFFGIDFLAALIPLAIDVTSFAIPFMLVRRLQHAHQSATLQTPDQQVAQDKSIQLVTSIFGASVYSLVLFAGFNTILPVWMVTYFDGVRSLEKAHTTALLLLLGLFVPLGFAATHFIFVPAVGNQDKPEAKPVADGAPFDPTLATISQTIAHNLGRKGSFTSRAETLFRRTLILAASSFVNTFIRSYVTIEGTELIGSLLYSSVWALAAIGAGAAYGYVGWD